MSQMIRIYKSYIFLILIKYKLYCYNNFLFSKIKNMFSNQKTIFCFLFLRIENIYNVFKEHFLIVLYCFHLSFYDCFKKYLYKHVK